MPQSFYTNRPLSKGFTLVELIVVIIILGILSATALPRFINLRTESIIASMDGLKGTIESAVRLSYAKTYVNNTAQDASSTIIIDGQTIDMVYGYPAGTANGIGKLVTAPSDDWKQRASSVSGAWVFWHGVINEDAGSASCYVRYKSATSDGKRPVVDFVDGGCATAQ